VTPEIRAFEFALGLFTVLIGLAIADVATSLHRLIRHSASVRWDPLTLLAALFALLMAVGMWFDLWGIRHATSVRHFYFYLVLVAAFFVLFLIAASSLPDEAVGPIDLRTFYERNRRYFWLLVTVFQVFYVVLGCYFLASVIDRIPRAVMVPILVQWAVLIIVPATLLLVRSRRVHYVGLALLFAVALWHYYRYSIN
jgi:hypothetical protein